MSQIPLFQPDSEWIPPEKIPNLSDATEIAIDLETCDPDLKTLGPGWPTGNGYVARAIGYNMEIIQADINRDGSIDILDLYIIIYSSLFYTIVIRYF